MAPTTTTSTEPSTTTPPPATTPGRPPASLGVRHLVKRYETGAETVDVLAGVSLDLAGGQSLAVTGPSGSGKSTLLHILGTLDQPTEGAVAIGGRDPFTLPEAELARFRNQAIGFVFQDHHLLPQYSLLENVLLPTLAFPEKGTTAQIEDRARELLDRVGLGHRLAHRPAELSGGERQRTAIARALIQDPILVLCDEPTGNLDRNTATKVTDLLLELHQDAGNVLIVVTHSLELAGQMASHSELEGGVLVPR